MRKSVNRGPGGVRSGSSVVSGVVQPLVLAALLLFAGSGVAGTWMRSEQESYYSARVEYEVADSGWNQDNQRVALPCTARNWKVSQTYEYGLTYYRTLFGTLDYLDRSCDGFDASGVGDLELGVRSRIDIFRNGKSWEAAVIMPTGYSTSGTASVGSGLYGARVGAYARFDLTTSSSGEGETVEVGSDLYFWEGAASEQLSAYIKAGMPLSVSSRLYAALEGDYAISARGGEFNSGVNPVRDYGYDKLTARVGYSTKLTRHWRVAVEAASVVYGRNVNDGNTLVLSISRNFKEWPL